MKKSSLKIITIAGIPVKVHWSFGLLFLWIGFVGFRSRLDIQSTAILALYSIVIFICIIFHEFGHALTAKRFGVITKDIILFPIGGVARLERLPEKPIQEFFIAVAGPLVNVGIALILGLYFLFFPLERMLELFSDPTLLFHPAFFIPWVLVTNLLLAILNMIPAIPMDGGRVLRSLLALRLSKKVATFYAVVIAQILAIGLFFLGIFIGHYILPFIALFVYFTAIQEYRMVKYDEFVKTFNARDLIQGQQTALHIDNPVALAIDALKKQNEKNFLVFNHLSHPCGILSENTIKEAVTKGDYSTPVGNLMIEDYSKVHPEDNLYKIFTSIRSQETDVVVVFDGEKPLGLIDEDTIDHFIQFKQQQAIRNKKEQKRQEDNKLLNPIL